MIESLRRAIAKTWPTVTEITMHPADAKRLRDELGRDYEFMPWDRTVWGLPVVTSEDVKEGTARFTLITTSLDGIYNLHAFEEVEG